MHERDGPAYLRIVRARFCTVVLLETFFQVVGASHIERLVGAFQNIGTMHHVVVVYYFKAMATEKTQFPMRINKYLALQKYCTRREADARINKGLVFINGRKAVLGDKVKESDTVEVKGSPRTYRYFAYYKPRGIITHSAQEGEEEIKEILPIEGVFPLGRLDKDSYGLIILTDDGRITDALLNPAYAHEKEYEVMTTEKLPKNFKAKMERGVDIGGYVTKPCRIEILGERKFRVTLTEGKKHQIRRMLGFFGLATSHLLRKRIMNVKLGGLPPGEYRPIESAELAAFLKSLGF